MDWRDFRRNFSIFLYSFINIATKDKYGFPLLSGKILLTVYADSQLFVWSDYWYTSAVKEKGDTLNGIANFLAIAKET